MKAQIAAVIFLGSVLVFGHTGRAAQNEMVLTWQARTYTPPGFVGRPLPTSNSEIAASVALVADGRPVDLNSETVSWFVNDKFWKSGAGMDVVHLNAPQVSESIVELRAELPNYPTAPSKTVEIPIEQPEAVIETGLVGDTFDGSEAMFHAQPYFFNVTSPKNLTFQWKVNGKPPHDPTDPEKLAVTVLPGTPSGFGLNLELIIENPRSAIEIAVENLALTYSP